MRGAKADKPRFTRENVNFHSKKPVKSRFLGLDSRIEIRKGPFFKESATVESRAEEPAANAASARNQAFPTRSIMSVALF
jgi:hypothetical protein